MDIVNEKTTSILTCTFKDENGAATTPNSGSYRIDDLLSGTAVKTDTAFTPSSGTHEITISSSENAILSTANAYETRLVTVTFQYAGSTKSGSAQYLYKVKNLSKVS